MINRRRVMIFVVVLVLATLAQAQTFTILHNFPRESSDGNEPYAGVIQDAAGNLYGTTAYGGLEGDGGCGVVYEVNTAGAETVLYSFCSQGAEGYYPWAPVIQDAAGNFYGTTLLGGPNDGAGVVFKLDTAGNETVLYTFTGSDGCTPQQGLAMDKNGNLFGTTSLDYCHNESTIFKVDSAGNFSVLHNFAGWPSDGANPQYGHQIVDHSGNLYGLTNWGGRTQCGSYGCGALYKLEKNKKKPTLVHSFNLIDGCYPYGSVMRDKAGNFYGTTSGCGSNNYGTVWKVSKKGKATVLHNFAGGTSDGCASYAGVTRDSQGNLYGVTTACGAYGDGALYEVSAQGTFTLLHSFAGYPSDGANPYGELLWNANGLFGTTRYGGSSDLGTVWSYVP